VESSATDDISALARVVRGRALRRLCVPRQGRLVQALWADPTPWQTTAEPGAHGPVLLQLPPECTLRIFSYLRGYELAAASQVCRAWHTIARDERLWQHVTLRQWGRARVLAAETAGAGAPLAHPHWASWRALHVGRHVRLFARPPVVMDCGSGYCRIGL
jgi:hypothetical protein